MTTQPPATPESTAHEFTRLPPGYRPAPGRSCESAVRRARIREDNDDHLTAEERLELVRHFIYAHGGSRLPSSDEEAYLAIIFDEVDV